MDEKNFRTIANLGSWKELEQFEQNAVRKGALTPEIRHALERRSVDLGRSLVAQKTGLDLSGLSPAEEKVVQAVSRYVAIKHSQGSHASRTFGQLRNHGLLGAAESAVGRASPTEGFKTLTEANQSEISYEHIILDHPEEFSARAIWYSRRALGLANASPTPPVLKNGETQTRTTALVQWLRAAAKANDGVIPPFSNEEAAAAIGMNDIKTHGRVHGNIQSRIDFACYRVGLPPLGLAADEPFAQAWSSQNRNWDYQINAMQRAAQRKEWSDHDFDDVQRESERLPGQAHLLWKDALATEEGQIKAWTFSFGSDVDPIAGKTTDTPRNALWSRDELILALDLYMRNRAFPLAKGAPEIVELSQMLNYLGAVLGQNTNGTYRNENGVYMKLMNFRSLDPEYTANGKKGLSRGNKDESNVWDQFSENPVRLAEIAQFIRSGITEYANDVNLAGPDEPGIEEAEEGKVATRVHRYRERDRRLVEEAKAHALKKYGRLFCIACAFDFSKRYGDAGAGIIDVHHTKPVHTMKPGEKTKVADLALLCSNCHRIVHSKRKWLTVERVREILSHEHT
ncbi:Predicted restriction endonuclease, HNH family [Variovorax sp. YR266]|uniref:HNH endonuclease n=1 Tax=Variovorax sp. YR266 TaxID=1884386 RepID=UPI00089A2DA9|nr:HNH endonuclease [Variovorax sp. YR266]SDZ67582.1 Predicted restriction endonuclease, HNH family [Variovorax sp. YR266]